MLEVPVLKFLSGFGCDFCFFGWLSILSLPDAYPEWLTYRGFDLDKRNMISYSMLCAAPPQPARPNTTRAPLSLLW